MGGRYYITGVQIGLIKGFLLLKNPEVNTNLRIMEILNGIEENQFIGNK